jgi:RPA family protein
MSQNDVPTREVARRVFASEFNDATYTFKEEDREKAPVYGLLPTGQKVNRVLFVATLLETEDVGSDGPYWKGKLVDPTGSAYVYAGQYQPDPQRTLQNIDTPAYVAVVGKPRTFETDEGETRVSIRPESITEVDDTARDAWVAEAAEATLDRIEAFDTEANAYASLATEKYEQTGTAYAEEVREVLAELKSDLEETAETPDLEAEAAAD